MTMQNTRSAIALAAALYITLLGSEAFAQNVDVSISALGRVKPTNGGESALPPLYNWMSSEIADAWNGGFKGQGSRVTIVDDFTSNWGYYGNLTGNQQLLRHGEWVRLEASVTAPSATFASQDFSTGKSVALGRNQLNILNLSYGMIAQDGFSSIIWGSQESSIISYASRGAAVVVKAAGNDGISVGAANSDGLADYLSRDLIGTQAAIFVGALDRNGTQTDQAKMATYSNFAGSNETVQKQFLSVGVRGDLTGLYGTSFAAPIVSGYAAVLGSKFASASPTQIANQLLNTARTDTIFGYDQSVHGEGEASITRALAPVSIN